MALKTEHSTFSIATLSGKIVFDASLTPRPGDMIAYSGGLGSLRIGHVELRDSGLVVEHAGVFVSLRHVVVAGVAVHYSSSHEPLIS